MEDTLGEKKINRLWRPWRVVNTLVYPSEVHHLLSPNDNNFHGVAKRRWRLDRTIDWSKDEIISLSLLHYLNTVESEKVIKYFKTNLFIGNYESCTLKKCKDIVGQGYDSFVEKKDFLDAAKKTYILFVNPKQRKLLLRETPLLKGFNSTFDGKYWVQ